MTDQTTNFSRVETILWEAMGAPGAARNTAEALSDAGLLAPDPVEPEGIERLSWGTIAQWDPVLGLGWTDDGMVYDTTPTELRHEAACLLSAARYAEERTAEMPDEKKVQP